MTSKYDMTVHILTLTQKNRKLVKEFVGIPYKIYQDIPQWVPPLSIDVKYPFNPHNPFYKHSKAKFFIAKSDKGEPLGRITLINNQNYNKYNQENTAFFWLFETINDQRVSEALFKAGFQWAREHGLNKIIGPKGFTPLDGSGLLVEGYEHRPAFGLPFNPPYYSKLIEASGFKPISDSVSGYLSSDSMLPEKIHRISDLVKQKKNLWIAEYTKRKDLKALVPKLKDLYNNALGGTEGNVPITSEEALKMANQMLRFADPELIKVVMKGEKPVGFLFAYPDVSEAIQKIRGRIFPFGWITLLKSLKTTEWVNVNGAGIIEEYRGLGGTAILFSELQKTIKRKQFKHADLVQIGMENDNMQRELRDLGIDFYKKHRLYERDL